MVLDSYLKSEPDVVAVCDCHCRYGLEELNTDRKILTTPPSCVDWHLTVDNETDAMETADVEVIECYCIVTLKRPMQVLKIGEDKDYFYCKLPNFQALPEGLQNPANSSPFGFGF